MNGSRTETECPIVKVIPLPMLGKRPRSVSKTRRGGTDTPKNPLSLILGLVQYHEDILREALVGSRHHTFATRMSNHRR